MKISKKMFLNVGAVALALGTSSPGFAQPDACSVFSEYYNRVASSKLSKDAVETAQILSDKMRRKGYHFIENKADAAFDMYIGLNVNSLGGIDFGNPIINTFQTRSLATAFVRITSLSDGDSVGFSGEDEAMFTDASWPKAFSRAISTLPGCGQPVDGGNGS